ncbi:hypothetical protein, partial [Mucilaginibacter koreensis]
NSTSPSLACMILSSFKRTFFSSHRRGPPLLSLTNPVRLLDLLVFFTPLSQESFVVFASAKVENVLRFAKFI